MSDRVKGFTVILEKDILLDEVEIIQEALSMIKGVASVQPHILEGKDVMERERIKFELSKKFHDFIEKELFELKI